MWDFPTWKVPYLTQGAREKKKRTRENGTTGRVALEDGDNLPKVHQRKSDLRYLGIRFRGTNGEPPPHGRRNKAPTLD